MKRIVAHLTISIPLHLALEKGMTEEQAIAEMKAGLSEMAEETPEGATFTFKAEVVEDAEGAM